MSTYKGIPILRSRGYYVGRFRPLRLSPDRRRSTVSPTVAREARVSPADAVTRAPWTISSIDTSANPFAANRSRAAATSAARVAAAYSSLRLKGVISVVPSPRHGEISHRAAHPRGREAHAGGAEGDLLSIQR